MKKDQITSLFSASFACDRKHRLNTTVKPLPLGLLKEFTSEGLTLERVEELLSEGYDIYRYQTQLTVHGLCQESLPAYVSGYKSVSINKNGSVGVRWISVDRAKKLRIIGLLKRYGWCAVSSSTSLHPELRSHHSTFSEAADACLSYKSIMDRVAPDLFYGSYSIYVLQSPYLGFFAVLDLLINGILEERIPALIESILDKPYSVVLQEVHVKDEAEAARRAELDAQWRAEREARKALYADSFQTVAARLESEGYRKVPSNALKPGTIFREIRRSYSDDTAYVETLLMCSRSAKKCDTEGNLTFDAVPQTRYKQRPILVWVR